MIRVIRQLFSELRFNRTLVLVVVVVVGDGWTPFCTDR